MVTRVDSDKKNSDFECYDGSEQKSVHVDVDKENTGGTKPILALLPNRSEEDEINKNGETPRDRDVNFKLRRLNRKIKPPERLGSVPNC